MKIKKIKILLGVSICILLIVTFVYGSFTVRMNKKKQEEENKKIVAPVKKSNEIDPTTYKEINQYVNSNDMHMIIIGQDGCYYCNLFKPNVRIVSENYNFNYMYVDIKALDKIERTEFLESGLVIPSKCSDDGEKTIGDGFGTPLTLFTRSGRTVDCLRGYKSETELTDALKDMHFIN